MGALDFCSGNAICDYINSLTHFNTQFRSEEKMDFKKIIQPNFYGIIDDLDGSINPLIGGINLNYIGVGGVIHEPLNDSQVSAAGYLPFGDAENIYVAEKNKGTYRINLLKNSIEKIDLSVEKSQKNILLESGFMTKDTLLAEQNLFQHGFYDEIGITARDKVTAGIYQTISGIKDNRQIILNFTPSHQADYCYLLLSEAGANVIGQDGNPMQSTSYAMLSIAPSFKGNTSALKEKFVEAMHDYQGWSPNKVVLDKVCLE